MLTMVSNPIYCIPSEGDLHRHHLRDQVMKQTSTIFLSPHHGSFDLVDCTSLKASVSIQCSMLP